MVKLKLTPSEKLKIAMSDMLNELNEKFKSNMREEQCGIEIIPGLASNGELVNLGDLAKKSYNKLPQAIIFDPIPLANGDYISLANPYTHIVNPMYALGECDPATPEEAIAIISTLEYVFMNRVKYLIMVLVQSSVCKMKKRFYDIDELKLYNNIMNNIDSDFGNVIYYLKSYIGDEAIVTKDTESHMVISMDTIFYNCLIEAMAGYPLGTDEHDFITLLVREFDMIISDYFDIYILEEIRTIYGPQLATALKKEKSFTV